MSELRPPKLSHFKGALLGQCYGDALGFAVEGCSPRECAAYAAELRVGRPGRSRRPFPFGQYTDDSQLARELALSLVAKGGFDPAEYGRRIAELFSEFRVVGRGQATSRAAERLNAGVPWDQAGEPWPSAGNGSAMRAAPIGLFFGDDTEKLRSAAVDQSRITHSDPRCLAGSVAVAASVAIALRGEPIAAAAFLEEVAGVVEPVEPSLPRFLRRLPELLSLPPHQAVRVIGPLGKDQDDGWPGISPFVTGTVLWSLYSFLRSPEDYLEAVLTAIEVGGDVDTTAAITGAISGARLGVGRLNGCLGEELQEIQDRGTWGYWDLQRLGSDLYVAARRCSLSRDPARLEQERPDLAALYELANAWIFSWRIRSIGEAASEPLWQGKVPPTLLGLLTQRADYRPAAIEDMRLALSLPRLFGIGRDVVEFEPYEIAPGEHWARAVSPLCFRWEYDEGMAGPSVPGGTERLELVVWEDGWRIARVYSDQDRRAVRESLGLLSRLRGSNSS